MFMYALYKSLFLKYPLQFFWNISVNSHENSQTLVQIDNRSENMASWLDVQAQDRQYHCLKELVVVGFNAVGWQIGFVRHVMKASPRMRRVHLLDGHVVEDKERVLEGLEVVPHTREWHEFERSEVLDDLWDGNGICSPQLEIILE